MEERGLTGKRYVYWWGDGIYFTVRLTDEEPCLLVIIGARANGAKELVAVAQGQRESKISWREVRRELKSAGSKARPSWSWAMARWASGLRKRKNFPKRANNAAGA